MSKRRVIVDGDIMHSLINELSAEIESIQESMYSIDQSMDSMNDIMLEIKRAIKPKKQVIHGEKKDK